MVRSELTRRPLGSRASASTRPSVSVLGSRLASGGAACALGRSPEIRPGAGGISGDLIQRTAKGRPPWSPN